VQRFIDDPHYCAQEKYDGRRILIQKTGKEILGINRRGLTVGLPEVIVGSAKAIPGNFIIDGECLADNFYTFDMLQGPGFDLRSHSYQRRLVALMNLLGLAMQSHIRLAETAFASGQKRDLLNWLRRENREGIVFKRLDAKCTPGRPNTGTAARPGTNWFQGYRNSETRLLIWHIRMPPNSCSGSGSWVEGSSTWPRDHESKSTGPEARSQAARAESKHASRW
jgi:hypothetical protein